MHNGEGPNILAKRHELYEAAKARNPERWNGRKTRDWTLPAEVYLNPEKKPDQIGLNTMEKIA